LTQLTAFIKLYIIINCNYHICKHFNLVILLVYIPNDFYNFSKVEG